MDLCSKLSAFLEDLKNLLLISTRIKRLTSHRLVYLSPLWVMLGWTLAVSSTTNL